MQTKSNIFLSLLLFSLLIFSSDTYGQRHFPFVPHEDMHMVVYYNWGFIWIRAGKVEMKANSLTYKNKKWIKFDATGSSLKKWNFIFALQDNYQSIVDLKGFKPLHFEKRTIEGGFWIHNIYQFDWKKQQLGVHTESIRQAARDTTYHLKRPLFDVLTAVYYLRTLETKTLTPGDTIKIPIISDGAFDTYHVVYAGLGNLRRKDKVISCHVYKAVITQSTFFSRKDPLVVYVTNDNRRLPVYVKANIIVGSIKVYLKPYLNYKVQKSNSQN